MRVCVYKCFIHNCICAEIAIVLFDIETICLIYSTLAVGKSLPMFFRLPYVAVTTKLSNIYSFCIC